MKQSGVVLQDDGARATPVLGFDVHIWRIALDTPISQMDLTALSPAELTRGSRFVFERDQRRHLAAHAALRTVLSVYIGQAPEELDLRETPEGKPVLADGRLAFNLSHSGELALVAVAAAGQVGVDIELVAPLSDEMSIARSLFAPSEVTQLESLTSDARRLMFYRFWTCREALLKAAGVGLSGEGLEIGMEANGEAYVLSPPLGLIEPTRLGEFRPSAHHVAAVAWSARGPQAVARVFDFDNTARLDASAIGRRLAPGIKPSAED
ncbi:MAG: 4'-phosphopantetheinyl transferase superfamily protein [Mesorhizobium sp.]|uniref:4'-phosphopantetheinyl transferase family protein n=1 Tax=Mesorhizobium sp. TaxID=1871066 RepID=UPI000FE642D6|nr:4'-phosphopantetheinyl transferase superfamily protein [Mesorhizobium sp.]RWC34954.1 MAG: 4'-phosphopantetheinyl transferase superfamily protein [Mesorhizobium sp.]RWE57089.1 MAG: 4'-phosphopantetheinyl transferase superfamily protein [Mesorhizobium sp.]RWF53846.1 MAG: 4'-phosphopantetheinyl transferase superfamily protein [Mesorhizobium sp.]TIX67377.1 MAG: 4'-phosphopantetheinyl transferase superfamily protein [Mesorhizobium sp.]